MNLWKRLFGGRGRPAAADPVLKGYQHLAALDETTCLECLRLDGTMVRAGRRPSFPLHEGCRCVVIPILKSWKELGFSLNEIPPGTRASSLGQIPADGGAYKAYLILRAEALAKGMGGQALAEHLESSLKRLRSRFPSESERVHEEVRYAMYFHREQYEAGSVRVALKEMSSGCSKLSALLHVAFAQGLEDEVRSALKRLAGEVPRGRKHDLARAAVYSTFGGAARKQSKALAIEFLREATRLNPESTPDLVKLGKLLRSEKLLPEARAAFEGVLAVNPSHKGARQELERLYRAEGT